MFYRFCLESQVRYKLLCNNKVFPQTYCSNFWSHLLAPYLSDSWLRLLSVNAMAFFDYQKRQSHIALICCAYEETSSCPSTGIERSRDVPHNPQQIQGRGCSLVTKGNMQTLKLSTLIHVAWFQCQGFRSP